MATKEVENEGESGDTTHPIQLDPRRHEHLNERVASIYGSHWSSLATPNNIT